MVAVSNHDPAPVHHPVLARLAPIVSADPVRNHVLGGGLLRHNFEKVALSGLDTIACAAARAVVGSPRSVALAVPRGRSPLPVLVGTYLALSRVIIGKLAGGICGSVAVSTRRTDLRDLARGLRFDGDELDAVIPVARLVTKPCGPTRVRAAALTLDRRARKGLSQNDSFLLFMLPNRMPPVALNVISAMVCDTFGTSEASWETTHERNVAARRREVWLGELGDNDFEAFCERHGITLLRLDWPLLHAAAATWGTGASRLATTAACRRALAAPTIGYRVVAAPDVDKELRELTFALAEMRRRGRDDPPDAMRYAGQLANLLARLACPVGFYEQAVRSHPMNRRIEWLCERVVDASSASFRNRYKQAFQQYWTTVKGASKELTRTLTDRDSCPKFWAVQERVVALGNRERLRVLCQTRAERDAVRAALLDDGLVGEADLDTGRVTVAAFSERADHGEVSGTVTLLCAPPPPSKAALYLSGEAGRVEVLCYPFEVGRLRAGVRRAVTDHRADEAALTALALGANGNGHNPLAAPEADDLLVELDGYGELTAHGPDDPDREPVKLPDADAGFWESAAALYDTELPLDDGRAPATGDGGEFGQPGTARLVRFIDGPPMYLAEDADCTVVVAPFKLGDEPDVMSVPPAGLERGMRIAVLPGSERGGLLAELMAAWDEGIALVRARYEPIYYRALDAAVAEHGLTGVAAAVGLSRRAVQLWHDRWNWPGAASSLRKLLELSGDEEAVRNQVLIQDYFSRVRGAHRYIGRVLNDAVGETVLHEVSGRHSISKLEALVGRDLTDLFDATSVLTVESVGDPEQVPSGVCGSFLDPDDPYLKAKGATTP